MLDVTTLLDGHFPALAVIVSVSVASVVYFLVKRFVEKEFLRACCKPKPGRGVRGSPLYSYDEIMPYMRGNPYITHGYRKNYSWRETMRSLFTWHNETANIWSHGLAWLLFCFFTVQSVWDLLVAEAHADLTHQVTVVVYCTGAMALLACSTTFHWMGCVSDEVYKLTAKLDYTGIAVLILVSFFPFMYR
jgi:adiponectin receptor